MARSDVAFYVWDYFYLSHHPEAGDETAWAVIERATCRIHESAPDLEPPAPSDVRLARARRVRNAVRTALRHIQLLSVPPASWVVDGLVELGARAAHVIETVSAAGPIVH